MWVTWVPEVGPVLTLGTWYQNELNYKTLMWELQRIRELLGGENPHTPGDKV